MSQGVLLFARDTDTRSYTRMAKYCAAQVKRYLKLPVALVTDIDADIDESLYDHVIRVSSETQNQNRKMSPATKVEQWRNFNRYQAYTLSPFDETILMDTDFIVNSTRLLTLFYMNKPFLCHRRRLYLGKEQYSEVETYGRDNEMYWATVVYFKRSPEAESIFSMMQMIQENYDHYSKIYRFSAGTYRNDYAISIAINTVYGHIAHPEVEIPWPLMNVEFTTDVKRLNDDSYELQFERLVDREPKPFKITTSRQDLHILNKDALFTIIENEND